MPQPDTFTCSLQSILAVLGCDSVGGLGRRASRCSGAFPCGIRPRSRSLPRRAPTVRCYKVSRAVSGVGALEHFERSAIAATLTGSPPLRPASPPVPTPSIRQRSAAAAPTHQRQAGPIAAPPLSQPHPCSRRQLRPPDTAMDRRRRSPPRGYSPLGRRDGRRRSPSPLRRRLSPPPRFLDQQSSSPVISITIQRPGGCQACKAGAIRRQHMQPGGRRQRCIPELGRKRRCRERGSRCTFSPALTMRRPPSAAH